MSVELDENDIIVSDGAYQGFKVLHKPFELGDFVIPVEGLESTYRYTNQTAGWLGVVWNLADFASTGHVYPVDCVDSYNVRSEDLMIVEPTEQAINWFINMFKDIEHTNELAIDACFHILKTTHSELAPKLSDLFPSCPLCGARLTRSNSIMTTEDDTICRECHSRLYTRCGKCGNSFKRKNIESHEELCAECNKREFILPYHRWYPDLKFFGDNHNNSVPYLGIELEVDEGGHYDDSAATIMRIMNNKEGMFIYCSHDGSLENGFEIITQPATLEYHTSIKGFYSDVFTRLRQLGYSSHDTITCGLHVHFNRDFFAENEEICTTKLLYLIEKFWDNIVIFSRRNERRLERYAKKLDETPHNYFIHRNKSGRHDDHYYSINIGNQNTIEFRMFKGTMNIATFFSTLCFVNNCIIAAKEKTTEEIQSMLFSDLITTKEMKKYWKRRMELSMPNEE